jgi:hypothetical protein
MSRSPYAAAEWGRPLWRPDPKDGGLADGKARHVARVLADHADRDGECRLKVSTIAREIGLSDRSVRRALEVLVAEGHVACRRCRGASFYGLRGGPFPRPVDYQPGSSARETSGHPDRPSPADFGQRDRPSPGSSVTVSHNAGHGGRSRSVKVTDPEGVPSEGIPSEGERTPSEETDTRDFPPREPQWDWRPDVRRQAEERWHASIAALVEERLPTAEREAAVATVTGVIRSGRATTPAELDAHLRRWNPELLPPSDRLRAVA